MKIDYIFQRKFTAGFAISMFILYIGSIYVLSFLQACRFMSVVLFQAGRSAIDNFLIAFASSFAFITGVFLLFLIPGWIFNLNSKKNNDFPVFIGKAFLTSILSMVFITTVYKAISPHSLDRISLLMLMILLMCIGLAGSWINGRGHPKQDMPVSVDHKRVIPYLFLVSLIVGFLALFSGYIFDSDKVDYDYNEQAILEIPLGEQTDLLERFGLANSLNEHLMPRWDLEYENKFGYVFTDPPLYAFITNFSILLFGETKTTLRLVSIVFIAVMFLIIMAQSGRKNILGFMACGLILFSYLLFFLNKIDELTYTVPFFTFLVTMSYLYLMRNDKRMFLMFAAAATLTKFYGIFFAVLAIFSLSLFFKEQRREAISLLKTYALFITGFGIVIAAVGAFTGNLEVYWRNFVIEHFLRLDLWHILDNSYPGLIVYNPSFSMESGIQFLHACLWGTGFMFPVLFLFGKDRGENFFSLIALVYIVLIFISRYHMNRYMIPVIPLTAIVVSSKLDRWATKRNKGFLYSRS